MSSAFLIHEAFCWSSGITEILFSCTWVAESDAEHVFEKGRLGHPEGEEISATVDRYLLRSSQGQQEYRGVEGRGGQSC